MLRAAQIVAQELAQGVVYRRDSSVVGPLLSRLKRLKFGDGHQ
jgi:hypothetical protein